MAGRVTVRDLYQHAMETGHLKPDAAQAQAVTALDMLFQKVTARQPIGFWSRLFKRPEPSMNSGLYIYGPVGRGKSMLMQFFIDAVKSWNTTALRPLRIERHHFHAFMLDLHHQLHLQKDNPERMQNRLTELADELIKRVDILCFDEFHVTDTADAMLLMPYFTRVLEGGVTLVATSNFAPLELYQNGLQRARFLPFIALLQNRLTVISISGQQDYRLLRWQDKAAHQDHWLMPLNAHTAEAFQTLFADLVGYDDVHEDVAVEVPDQQRTITVSKASAHVAWIQMDDVLNGAVGAADFLALTAYYKVILLDNIPVFATNDNNRAKRFMLLVDTLYEANTQIYVRAAAEPEQLYPTTDRLAFEFARTVSRLQEMRYKAQSDAA
jgi:cell division protein ZapE